MMSELVAGSAWMKPPVEGPGDGESGAAAAAEVALPVPPAPGALAPSGFDISEPALPPPPDAPPPPEAALKAARSTVASLVTSALLRWTTQMLPAPSPPGGGRSSLATSEWMFAILLAFVLRTMSELLRGSTRIVEPPVTPGPAPGAPGVAALSVRRWISGATSEATA